MERKVASGILLAFLVVDILVLTFNVHERTCALLFKDALSSSPVSSSFLNVSVSNAKNMMDSIEDLVVIDVRNKEEYSKGHIENAFLIPLSILEDRIDGLDKLEETLIYCKSGKRSTVACRILIEKGFVNVCNMLGGIKAWEDAGYPLTPPEEGNRRASDLYTYTDCKRAQPDYLVHLRERTGTGGDALQNIRDAISKKGAKWIADETSVSQLTFEERKLLFSAKFANVGREAEKLSIPPGVIPFGTFDWRNVNGTDWMTPVKNQGTCGSCWAFGTLGSMEAIINIVNRDPTIDMDLSEQFLVSCCDTCGDCRGGYPHWSYDFLMYTGVPSESCFPYVASDVPCTPCLGWEEEVSKITDWHRVSNDAYSIKWALQSYGPLGVEMNAPDDFLYYSSGVYEPVWSSPEWDKEFTYGGGNHWVTLVGYDDNEGYWIVKNSWGVGWGEEGYAKIAYGVLEKYDAIYAITSVEAPVPQAHNLAVTLQVPRYMLPDSASVLNATVHNLGLNDETDIELHLYINSSMIDSATIPELVKGSSYTLSYMWTPTVEAEYNVTAYAPPVSNEKATANNVESIIVLVQVFPNILIVNDDDGSSLTSGTSLPDFEAALRITGYDFMVWNESSKGNPPLELLTKFKLVVWTCGDYWNKAVDPTDVATLESYLTQGGRLLLEGGDIGYDHGADDFMVNVAHAVYQVDDAGAPGLTVTDPSHPVVTGLPSDFTWATDPPYDDGVTPANRGMEVIQYTGTGWTAVTVFEGTVSKVVYCAFPLYCLDSREQETLAINSVNWLLEPPRAFGWVEDIAAADEPFPVGEQRPSMATDSNGYLYVAYEHYNPDSRFYEIYVSKSMDNGDSWSIIGSVSDDYNLGYPSIAIDVGDNNNIFVAYEREVSEDDHDIFVLRYVDGSWDVSPVDDSTDDDRYPSITTEYQYGNADRQYISYEWVWSHDDRDLMFGKSEDDGATWSIKQLHGGWPDSNVHCQTSVTTIRGSDGNDYIFIAYKWGAQYDQAYDIVIDKSIDRGDTWTQQWVCDENSRDKNWPSITATHGGGTVVIAWHVYWDSTFLNDVQYTFSTNNGDDWNVGWLALEANMNEETPTLTVDGQDSTSTSVYGCVHVAYWRDNEIYYREAFFSSPWLWTSTQAGIDMVANVSIFYTKPAITTYRSTSGRYLPAVAWTDLRNGNDIYGNDIYYSTKGPIHTIDSHPSARTVEVDDESYTASMSFCWIEGSTHKVNASSPQYVSSDIRFVFENWSDGGAQSHVITAGISNQNITVYFNVQYNLSVTTNPSELAPQPTVTPLGPWYNNGTLVNCTAQTVDGYTFSHWMIDETNQGQSINPIVITMDEPHTVIAHYLARNIAVTDVTPSKNVVEQSYSLYINVTVENQGDTTETFNLTLYANSTAIQTQKVTLADGSSDTIIFVWNTTDFPTGNYTLNAYAWPVPDETETDDNQYINGIVQITVPDNTPPNITDVSQIPLEDNVQPDDEVIVNATVIDVVSGVESVALNYTNGNGTWVIIEMTSLSVQANVWSAIIQSFPYGTNVTYIVIAEDAAGNTVASEELGYDTQYQVVPEFPPFLILSLLIVVTLLAVIVHRSKNFSARATKTPVMPSGSKAFAPFINTSPVFQHFDRFFKGQILPHFAIFDDNVWDGFFVRQVA